MKRCIFIIFITFIFSCAPGTQTRTGDVKSEIPPKEDYFDIIAERLAFHLSTYISQNNKDLIKDAIYYEMPYPRIYAILVFQPDGKYIDGFIKENGKIVPLIYTVYFRDPAGMSFKVKKIYFNRKQIGILKLFYR